MQNYCKCKVADEEDEEGYYAVDETKLSPEKN
jgi:hypothetical protein